MRCGGCGQENREGRKFCAGCGARLAVACPACGTANEPGERFCGECGVALPVSSAPQGAAGAAQRAEGERSASGSGARKVVTIVFGDLVGSTALHERLDAESVRQFMEGYYAAMRGAVEAHGGRVTQVMGDGVKAVFGAPRVAEDDAIRAVRAGVEMQRAFRAVADEQRDRVGKTGLRVAVNTGEVVTDDDTEIIGDPVNVAARLQEQGKDGDVVIGGSTQRIVGSLVTLDRLGSFALKGRTEQVEVYRVVSLEPPAGAAKAAFVGRDEELGRVTAVYETAVAKPAAALAVLLGSPGLGKSRLIDEFVRRLGEGATVLLAHCDAAGGATFAPLVAALRERLGIEDGAKPEALRAAVEAVLLGEDAEGTRIVGGVAALLSGSPASPEETFFVIRRLLAALAATRPVVLVIDDLHWAESLLLDLVEHLVQWGSGIPLFVLVGARPELCELRSSLVTPGGVVADVLTLAGLDAGAAMRLAAGVIGAADLPAALAAKLLATSEGNPLFVGELVKMLVQEGVLHRDGERWVASAALADLEMPPTIHALLAARIERLRPEERAVLERAAVVGRHFSKSAVAALLSQTSDLEARLEALRRSELIERDTGWFLSEPVLRFHHVLIRDAAYRRVLKGTRAELHARLADWIEAKAGDAAEHDETIGWHLEQAHQHLHELGPLDAQGVILGERAARRLAAAGRRALARDDVALAASGLGRALACLPAAALERADLALDWCEALLSAGDVGPASAALEELDRASAGSERLRAWHSCFAGQLTTLTSPQGLHATAESVAAAATALAALGDAAGEAKAHFVHAQALARLGKVGACEAALDLALAAARRAGDRRRANAVLAGAPRAALWGPSPVTRASGRCLDVVRVLRITQGAPAVEAVALSCQGVLEALRGRTDAAKRMIASSRKLVEELGIAHRLFEADVFAGRVALLEGDASAAEQSLRGAYEGLRDLGLGIDAAQAAALLARALLGQGRAAEAETLSHESEALAGDDLQAAIAWRGVRAEALAQRGEHAAGVALAQAAVEIAAATDALLDHADARLALAAALRAAGRRGEADAEERRAFELWEAKGATLLAERARHEGAREPSATPVPASVAEPPQQRRVGRNAATENSARLDAAVAARDADALLALLADDMRIVDHTTGIEFGREGGLASWRALIGAREPTCRHEPLATLGDSLGLLRLRLSASGAGRGRMDVGAYDKDEIYLVEADAHSRRRWGEVWAPSHLGEAVARLYQRYAELCPEGPKRARAEATARSVAALVGATSRGYSPEAWSSEIEFVDHRAVGLPSARGAGGMQRVVDSLYELADGVVVRTDDVFRLEPYALLVRSTMSGTDRASSGTFEFAYLALVGFDDSGRLRHYEAFDADREAEALARFDELIGGAAPKAPLRRRLPTTAATRHAEHLHAALEARSLDAIAALHSERLEVIHHPSGAVYGLPEVLSLNRNLWRGTNATFTQEALAALGDSLVLVRRLLAHEGMETRVGSIGPVELETAVLLEVDEREGVKRTEVFAAERLGDAVVRLYERYAEGLPEGPAIERAEVTARSIAAFVGPVASERWAAAFSPDLEQVDHRTLGSWSAHGAAPALDHLRALQELAADTVLRVDDVLAATPTAVLDRRTHTGSDRESGGRYERSFLGLSVAGADGRIGRIELFDVEREAEALTRFDALAGSSSAAPAARAFTNAAARADETLMRCFNTRDWAGVLACVAPEVVFDERRRMLRNTADKEVWLAQFRFLFDVPESRFTVRLLATRGERLSLHRHEFEGEVAGGGGPLAMDPHLTLHEVDREGHIVAIVLFDLEDEAAAHAELDARFEAGEGAADSRASRWVAEFRRAFASRDWDTITALQAPDQVAENHRLVGWGTLRGAGAWTPTLQELVALSPDVRQRVDHLRVCETGNLWHYTWLGTREGGNFEVPMLVVVELDEDGHQRHLDVWDPEMGETAFARFAEIAARGAGARAAPAFFANAATRAVERGAAALSARDWDAFATLFAPSFRNFDRTAIGKLEVDREQWLAAFRQQVEMTSAPLTPRVLATRGERLALVRILWLGSGGDVGLSELDWLLIIEVDERGDHVAVVSFEPGDLDAAYTELDARYEAHAPAWMPGFCRAATRRDWHAIAELSAGDLVAEDHRLVSWGTLRGLSAYLPSLRSMVDLAPDVRLRLDHLRAAGRAELFEAWWLGTRDGGAFEIPVIGVSELDERRRQRRLDLYDLEKLDRAHARFEEIRASERRDPLAALPRPNAASAWLDRFQSAFNTRDWDALRALYASDVAYEDRQRLSLLSGGIDMLLSSVRERAEAGARLERAQLLGSAGRRIAIQHLLWAGGGAEGRFEMEHIVVQEVDEAGRLVATINFDIDDARAAQREAWARWSAADAAAATVVEPLSRMLDAWNAQDLARLRTIFADDLVADDHRRTGFGRLEGVDEYLRSVAAVWKLAPDSQLEIGWRWLALARHGAISVVRRHGVLPEGGAFESEYLYLYTAARGLITCTEAFELDAAEAALARLEALRPDPLRIPPNASTRANDRWWALAEAEDWDAVRALTEGMVFEDRRRLIRLAGGSELLLADTQHLWDSGWRPTRTLLATAGERLSLERMLWTREEGAQVSEIEVLKLAEIDAEGRIVAYLILDADDRAAASEELFERWVRQGADGVSPATIEFLRAWNAHDLGRMRTLLPSDYVFHDHRRTGIGRVGGAEPYVASLAALWELSADVRLEMLYKVAQAQHGYLIVQRWFGTNTEGGEFEAVFVGLTLYRGGRPVAVDLFEIDDLDAALARFEELRPNPLRISENAAMRAMDRLAEALDARDWDAYRALASDEFRFEDRTKRALVSGDVEVWIASARFLAAKSAGREYELLGTVGDRISIDRVVWSGAPNGTYFELERIRVAEVDATGRLRAFILFDGEDRRAAFEEAQARFLTGEAAGVSGQAPVRAFVSAVGRHDWEALRELLASDFVFDDHRTLGMGVLDRERWVASVRAQDDLTRDLAVEDFRTLAWNRYGRVTVRRIFGTNLEGGPFENVFANVMLCEGDLIWRVEVFDLDAAERAVARFHELCATRTA